MRFSFLQLQSLRVRLNRVIQSGQQQFGTAEIEKDVWSNNIRVCEYNSPSFLHLSFLISNNSIIFMHNSSVVQILATSFCNLSFCVLTQSLQYSTLHEVALSLYISQSSLYLLRGFCRGETYWKR